jgi:hypothetical protein
MSPANTMSEMPLQARRVFRLSLTAALSLACAYGLQLPLPFIAPVFAIMLTITPAPPMGLKSLLGLILIVLMTLGIGLLLIPLLLQYALTAVLLVALGLYLSFYLSLHHGKVLVGTLLTVGFTMISAAGTVNFSLATTVIQALVIGISVAIACQWLVYPWFAEDAAHAKPAATTPCDAEQSHWLALRGTLIMLPTYLLALSNPAFYMPILMKTSSLSHQSNLTSAREAGRELLGSTFLAGCFAILFWVMLSIAANLWMFFWLMLLFSLYFSSKISIALFLSVCAYSSLSRYMPGWRCMYWNICARAGDIAVRLCHWIRNHQHANEPGSWLRHHGFVPVPTIAAGARSITLLQATSAFGQQSFFLVQHHSH